ncbi:hypothetical protein BuS5_00674 [Desulfosarcina sp. BuS5]|uniref:hypothetical protein n=1 Tax=Desulfosarcina sp. BuS5 TaxID=933262 RepID=UPI001E610B95|nr:hypothetical protein [Desulfosarcina sp. BuS5]WDN87706.1 hypothetical protein BuS5_00674 [Desulfosarcina sp. BuS5]
MRVQVLDEATADLADGFRFYERQADGLGDYFLDSLWSDIQSLQLSGGAFIRSRTDIIASFLNGFLMQCTTELRMVLCASEPYSTAAGIQSGYRNGLINKEQYSAPFHQ